MDSPTTKYHGLKHLFKGVQYSMAGLGSMFTETSFRHELILAIVMLPAAWLCPGLSLLWRTLLTLLWLAMPLTECINTAIESIVDLASPAIHPLAKRAKDLGSAAVFLTILANLFAWSVAIWIVISHVMQH